MTEKFIRSTFVYGEAFWDFYNAQSKPVQAKIDFVIGLVRIWKVVPEKFFKYLKDTDGLFEMRIKVGSNIYRIFCFFDKGNLVILLNGFQKKSNNTPKNEIRKAEKLKQQYYDEQRKS